MAEVAEEFAASLSDLTVNSKPHINMLTMLAEDNHEYAFNITQTVLNHLQKVPPEIKLPVLYLIDSIVKNVGKSYIPLFTQAIVQHFSQTFEKVDEKTREQMFKLRQTWNDVFPAKVMYALDSKVQKIDPAWPCTASPPSTVHLNPKFFKADILDSKSLTTTIKDPDSHRPRNRKNRTVSQTHSSSSRSKKSTSQVSSTSSVDGAKTPSSSSDSLREQVILQQKMLLELQQQKLKLELLQTQAQLEEQQKQLEKQSLNHKTSSESSAKALKLQQMVNQEEVKYKLMSKNLKKHMQIKFPKLQEMHRATTEMKAQAQKADVSKGSPIVPEGLLKPAALLELNQDELHVKPAKPAASVKRLLPPSHITPSVPKEIKSRNVHLQAIEKHKVAVPADSTEDVAPPVRIAPVSSQLINAALSFGRNVRDPRIRQMSSRLESQLNSSTVTSIPTSTPLVTQPVNPSSLTAVAPFPTKKSETSHENKTHSKSRKDKKSSNSHHHRDKSARSSEEDSKLSKSPNRSSDKSNRKGIGKGEKSPSKKGEEKTERKSKVDDLFLSRSKSPIHVRPASSSQSPSKSNSKRDQESLPSSTVEFSPKSNVNERVYRKEPSPKRTKLHNWPSTQSVEGITELADKAIPLKQTLKLNVDVKALQNKKQPDSSQARLSPESLDSSADMLDEDIEQIVKSAPKINRPAQKDAPHLDDTYNSPKSLDDSPDASLEDIVKHPSKQMKIHEINKSDDTVTKATKLASFEVSNQSNVRLNLETKTIPKSINTSESVRTGPKTLETICKTTAVDVKNTEMQVDVQTTVETLEHNQAQQLLQTITSVNVQQNPVLTSTTPVTFSSKDPRLHGNIQESTLALDKDTRSPVRDESNANEMLSEVGDNVLYSVTEPDEVSSSVNVFSDNRNDINEKFAVEEVVMTEISEPEQKDYEKAPSKTFNNQISSSDTEKLMEIQNLTLPSAPILAPPAQQMDRETKEAPLFSSNYSEKLTLSPRNVPSPVRNIPTMDPIHEIDENVTAPIELSSPQKLDKMVGSPVHQEKKARKGEKPSIMEQLIADAEKHDASPSPPPPPVISDKFKEIKQSSLSRLRRVGRPRDDLEDSESPEPADVDLRTQIQPPTLIKDPKNEVLGLADKDVDLRNMPPASPTKKRPSMEKLLDAPPAKKSKAEVMDELFGSEDVDLRPVLCPPPPSPPPPPIISRSPPPDSAGEKLWARYKETKPDTYKAKYTPSRRDRAPSVDKFSSRNSESGWQGRTRTSSYQKDIDMRAQPPGVTDGSYNHIIMQAYEQHQRGDLNADAYKRVLSEVCAMREKRQLEEAQRREEEEAAQAEPLHPLSDDDISGGSLSGVEDAPSPTDSYTGEEDPEELSLKKSYLEDQMKPNNEQEIKDMEGIEDMDIRLPPTDVDIRIGFPPRMGIDDKMPLDVEKTRKTRGESPYSRRPRDVDKDRLRSHREEVRAQKREKRARRSEERRGLQYRNSRYEENNWSPRSPHEETEPIWNPQIPQKETEPPLETRMDVEPPRVPPITHYRDPLLLPRDFSTEPRDSPSLRPLGPWDMQRMVAPPPWLPGMAPPPIGPPGMGLRPILQERFMPPRWRQPGPMFEGEPPDSRFNRFGPPMGRFPVPLAPCEVPPTDPAVLKLIEEDPTKSICIDGMPKDIRFYGSKAVALMNWDDPREVLFQNGSRHVVVDDRDSIVVHLNSPPQEIIIDGKPHRLRFGAPTRELYIDNQWYEAFFGGPPLTCDIGGKPHKVLVEGPPPNVRLGVPRKDLVVGKITLVIDAVLIFPIFLDAKPQKFEVDGIAYIIRFVEALQKTVINGVAFKSDFGGLPKPIILNGTKHFFRLTALPRGITPGYLTIVNMEGGRLPSPPTLPAPPQLPASLEKAVEFNTEPNIVDSFLQPPPLITAPPRLSPEILNREVDTVSLPATTLPPPIAAVPSTISEPAPTVNTLDMLTTLMPTPEPGRAVDYSYSVDSESSNHTSPLTTTTAVTSTTTTAPSLIGEINVTELLQKLMATGIVPKLDQPKDKDHEKPVTTDSGLIRPVDFRKPETLKIRQSALISHLYSGIQCNSCGVRFPPEQTMKYSQHLDWHFRQNRRDKDSTRTAQSRRYYYDVNDWVQFEEIEDLEERAQPWFEMQEGAGVAGAAEETPPAELLSVRAADYPEDAACHICQDKFESFYNEEKEEWQLRNAVDTEGKLAHPLCIEDQRAAAEKPIVLDDIDITGDESKEEEDLKETKEPEAPAKVEEDDDIMEVTDIEFIKPVFPVEDLTVSDSESVADNNEEKSEILEDEMKEQTENKNPDMDTEVSAEVKTDETQAEPKVDDSMEETKDGDKTEDDKEENDKMEELPKDDNTQDDLIVVDKGEDSVLSEAEILEVVRNIKKDPDALGGEYEEPQDPDVKKEKGEVPLPSPVVDTTHTTVTCLIDGNVEFEETPQQLNVGGPPKIKINITKSITQSLPKEPKESTVEIEDSDSSVLAEKLALVTQPPPPGEELIPVKVKERLRGKQLQDLPLVRKGKEMSGLCSIM